VRGRAPCARLVVPPAACAFSVAIAAARAPPLVRFSARPTRQHAPDRFTAKPANSLPRRLRRRARCLGLSAPRHRLAVPAAAFQIDAARTATA